MKIAFVDYVLEPDKPGKSGLSDLVWDMAIELASRGEDVHVIASYTTNDYPDSRVTVHNFETPPIGYRNIIGQFWILKRASDIVKRLAPDIVHAPEYVSTAVMHLLQVNTPLVLTVPGNIYHRLNTPNGSSYEWYFAQILKWAARRSARHCAYIIAISKAMKYWWEKTGSDPERTPMIPLGADPLRFHYVPGNVIDAEDNHSERAKFVFLGRFAKEKGLQVLLDAVMQLSEEQRSQIAITLIGEGEMRAQIDKAVATHNLHDCVSVLPWVAQDHLNRIYSAADALILPSHTEGLSRTILQSMLCGTPVVGSRISGTEDQVHDGKTGFLFNDGDATQLAAILKSVSADPTLLRNMRKDVLDYAHQHLTWERVIDRIVTEVYHPIATSSIRSVG